MRASSVPREKQSGNRASPPTAAAFRTLADEFERRTSGERSSRTTRPRSPKRWRVRSVERHGRHPQGVAEGARRAGAQSPELLGGSADLTGSNLTDFPGCGAVRGGAVGRAPHQLRRARIRHGRRDERYRAARRLHPVRRHLPDLQRLQPQRDPHGRVDEAARHPCLHPRFDRPRRRRTDAPARRARSESAPDPQPRRLAPMRRGGNGGRLDPVARTDRPTLRAPAVAAEPAGTGQVRRAGRRYSTRRLRAERPRARCRHPPRHRVRSVSGDGRAGTAGRRGHSDPGRLAAVFDGVRPSGPRLPRGVSRPRHGRASASKPASPAGGASTAAARRSASTPSASPRRRRRSTDTSA